MGLASFSKARKLAKEKDEKEKVVLEDPKKDKAKTKEK